MKKQSAKKISQTAFDIGVERVLNWTSIRVVVIDDLKRKKIKYRGTLPVNYLQSVWHNRQGNANIKKILNALLGKAPEDK